MIRISVLWLTIMVMVRSGARRPRLYGYRERKWADTIGTVLIPWAGHFQ